MHLSDKEYAQNEKEKLSVNKTVELAWVWYLKGKEQLSLNNYQEALVSAERAIAINPESGWAWRLKSNVQRNLGDYAGEKVSAENANKIAWSWCFKSDKQLHSGDYRAAFILAEKAIEIDENSAWAWRLKSAAQRNLSDCEGALISIKRAIAIDPDSEWAWTLYDEVQRLLRAEQKALEKAEDEWVSRLSSFLRRSSAVESTAKDSYSKLLVSLRPTSNEDEPLIPSFRVY